MQWDRLIDGDPYGVPTGVVPRVHGMFNVPEAKAPDVICTKHNVIHPLGTRCGICPTVAEGRLLKRVAKLTQQRDHWKAEHDKLYDVLDRFQNISRRVQTWDNVIAEQKRVRALEKRVEEQATLIEMIRKQGIAP